MGNKEQIPKQRIGDVYGELAVEKHGDVVVIVAKDEDFRPFGVLVLDLSPNSYAELCSGLVSEEYRRKGVMTALVAKAVELAKEAGKDRIKGFTNPANEASRQMCEKLGWFEYIALEKRL